MADEQKKIITIDEFVKDLQSHKDHAYNKAWFVLFNGLDSGLDKVKADIAKYIINRKDGMPTQKLGGEKESPLVIKIVNYGQSNDNNNTAPVRSEELPNTNPGLAKEISDSGFAQEGGKKQDNPKQADSQDATEKGALPVPATDIQTSKESDLAGQRNDEALPSGNN